ncbi:uncharacterized protein [Populus alba]|uniref:uncharacterized protein n=1 Tax=Populus alba TaxID=43335 RepID=UPI003CC7026B
MDNVVPLVRLVKSMREMGCEPYMGEQDAKIAGRWIRKVENTMIQISILEGLRVNYATQLLSDRAMTWWETVQLRRAIETLTWSDFKTKFENQFYSRYHRKVKEQEFLALRQGDMSVLEYKRKFHDLSLFAPHYVPTEEHMIDRLMEKREFDVTAPPIVKWESDGWTVALEGKLFNWDRGEGHKWRNYQYLSQGCHYSGGRGHFKRDCPKRNTGQVQSYRSFQGCQSHQQSIIVNRPVRSSQSGANSSRGRPRAQNDRTPGRVFHLTQEEVRAASDVVAGKGCIGYLAYILNSDDEGPRLKDILVVKEFPDVFPEELPGLPSEREVEVSIDIFPGVPHIAQQPYRMAPVEQNELKTQLQELLDKGFIRPSNSSWGAPVLFRVTFLGYVISVEGVFVDPQKVEAVLKWERSTSVTEIRSFLGLAGYYRRFIEDFSLIATPLTQLTRKNKEWVWSEEHEKSFQELKRRLTTAPVLTLPSGTEELIKDYDCTIEYHPGEANVVADALSRKNKATLGRLTVGKERHLEELKEMGADLDINDGGRLVAQLLVRPTYRE